MKQRRTKKTPSRRRRFRGERLESRAMLHAVGVLSGSVYFDVDNDGARDAAEVGVPGVVVSLADSAGAELQTFMTDDSGNYTFDELEGGTYQISKRQTPATIDGEESALASDAAAGNNVFSSVVLDHDATLNGFNFGEQGLKAEFISIRWFLASSPPIPDLLREAVARSEELAGDAALAEDIRSGGSDDDDDEPADTNAAPTAAADSYSVDEDEVLTVAAASGLLANDTDADDDSLTATVVSQPTNGTLTLNADGSFTYTPTANFFGSDSFTYRAGDGEFNSTPTTVTITVNSVIDEGENQAPVAAADAYSVDEDEVLTVAAASGVLANDTDADDDPLTATVVSQPTSGTVTLNTNGSFTYTPTANFSGSDSFTYRASDGELNSSPATVTITVNPDADENLAPAAINDTYTVEQDSPLTVAAASGVLANDTDADGDTLTASAASQPANGSLALNANGSFTYTPNAGFTGTDSFTYRANDGTVASNVGTVTITVTATVPENELFGPVTPGSFEDSSLRGIRTDLVAGAPPITANHLNGEIDYSAHSNPPTYGDHHGFDPNGTDVNPGITPRPTGVHATEQPDEDLVHNLEHGHVWISYNPSLISPSDLAALEQFVIDGSPHPNGGLVGVILTPRAANDSAIAVSSWARLQEFDSFNPTAVREFIEINRGKAPEGFITP